MIVTPANIQSLQVGFRRNFQEAFDATREDSAFARVATTVTSGSTSTTYGWLGRAPQMREWIGARAVKDMAAHGYSIVNKDWEATVGVDRNDIEDDNLGIYAPLMREMGMSAAEHPDRLVFQLLSQGRTTVCYDGQNFFDTDHPGYDATGATVDGGGAPIVVSNLDSSGGANAPYWYLLDTRRALKPLIFQERKKPEFVGKTDPRTSDSVFMTKEFMFGADSRSNVGFGFWQMAYASNAPLNGDNLDAAIAAMRTVRSENGSPLGIRPDLLVVGPELRADANKTVKVMLGAGGASNANYNAVEVLDTAWVA
ncbi:MAG: Mu-like prophage major head subunit gpT family protein [Paracoccaceae bacterium]